MTSGQLEDFSLRSTINWSIWLSESIKATQGTPRGAGECKLRLDGILKTREDSPIKRIRGSSKWERGEAQQKRRKREKGDFPLTR